MKNYSKETIGDSDSHDANKEVKKGFSWWIENGVYYQSPTVDPNKFGPHTYNNGDGTGDCPCGCYMGGCSSSGPVDPFGDCPENENPFNHPPKED